MQKNIDAEPPETYRIGDVANATDISVFTLRMWERRYGAPYAMKLDSGHRRYSSTEISRLRLVKIALDAGYKPSEVVALSEEKLKQFIEKKADGKTSPPHTNSSYIIEKIVTEIMQWDDQALLKSFEEEWAALGPIGFVSDIVSLLLKRIGEGWAYGEVPIGSEHFVSEHLQAFLGGKWHPLNQNLSGEKIIIATLSGELHNFGLHMCAIALTTVGHKVIFLGPSTPIDDICKAYRDNHSSGICISISKNYDRKQAVNFLNKMRQDLPTHAKVVIGGDGAPKNVEGVLTITSMREFYEWLRTRGFKGKDSEPVHA